MMIRILMLLVGVALAACSRNEPALQTPTVEYPETATVEHVDTYHGVEVADPYAPRQAATEREQGARTGVNQSLSISQQRLHRSFPRRACRQATRGSPGGC